MESSTPTEVKPKGALSRLWPRGLSGKLLVVTVAVVMLTEIFVFVPSIANYRLIWLDRHFDTGEAASIALDNLSDEDMPDRLRNQLLALTRTDMIVVRRDGASRVLATIAIPNEVARTVELTKPGGVQALASIVDAFDTLIFGGDRAIRVLGPMGQREGTLELVMNEQPLRNAMLSYARNVMLISLAISLVTGLVVFLILRGFIVRPMQRMTGAMQAFSSDPENPDLIIKPGQRHDEIGLAERQFSAMQNRVRGTLTQQRHLADLGLAVSKINHDLRNILASASLFSERLADIGDPVAQRLAPRLVRTIDRAVDYTNAVLSYGRAEEAAPKRSLVHLHRLCQEVAEALGLDGETDTDIEWVNAVPSNFEIEADPEQLFRIVMNVSRNAVQAMQAGDDQTLVRRLKISTRQEADTVRISIADTGPGIPELRRKTLFAAFGSSTTSGGTGLGLAIAAELVRAHGGSIALRDGDGVGTIFDIILPTNPAIELLQTSTAVQTVATSADRQAKS